MKIKVIRMHGGKAMLERGRRGWHIRFRQRSGGFVFTGHAWTPTLREARQHLHRQLGPQ